MFCLIPFNDADVVEDFFIYLYMGRKGVNCGSPFTGNGELLKEWMMQKRSDGITNAQYVIQELFGEEPAKKIATGKYKLTIEPVILFPLYNRYEMIEDAFGTGVYIEAPGYGWTSFSGKFVYISSKHKQKNITNLIDDVLSFFIGRGIVLF